MQNFTVDWKDGYFTGSKRLTVTVAAGTVSVDMSKDGEITISVSNCTRVDWTDIQDLSEIVVSTLRLSSYRNSFIRDVRTKIFSHLSIYLEL
jgi:hypothetical protein